jgi:hypothetical protein
MLTQPIKKELIDLVERYSPSSEIRDSPYEIQLKHKNGLWVTITYFHSKLYYSFLGFKRGGFIHQPEKFIKMWDKLKQFDYNWNTLMRTIGMSGHIYPMSLAAIVDTIQQEPYCDMVKLNVDGGGQLVYLLLNMDITFHIYNYKLYIDLDGYEMPFVASSIEALFPNAFVRQYKLDQLTS